MRHIWSDLDIFLDLDSSHNIRVNYDAEAAANAFINRLLTTLGERVMRPMFGTRLAALLHDPICEATATDIAHEILDAAEDEPRINIKALEVLVDHEAGGYEINMDIEIPQLKRTISLVRILRHTV